ncbi:hypothetical protein BD410DRAFT_484046 [Rickenella mellea]|uniref:Velvet domain-containing protein n=1 Tax=Rickenella mellea TaxID=50990 RepID=A0A4Y7QHG2_9AGAM|nr:hypothetical protein BD410DRAFT_484046 [Rickenella mellea]
MAIEDREYELTVRQEPKQARMCGVGGKADRRPIDPPPIVQLRVIDKGLPPPSTSASRGPSPSPTHPSHPSHPHSSHPPHPSHPSQQPQGATANNNNADGGQYPQSFLQNPYYFMFASLASPDRDEELHLLKDGKTRCTTGSVVSSLYHLKDTEADG